MEPLMATYLVYLMVSMGMTLWVAAKLGKHGKVFLADVFNHDEHLAASVNQLLVIGFYLINFGFVALWLQTDDQIASPSDAVETLGVKLGTVALAVGVVHLINVWVFNQVRQRRLTEQYLRRDQASSVRVEPTPYRDSSAIT
jgi:hypothetical protein